MLHCHEMKQGQVYGCRECGLELTVTRECTECDEGGEECCHGACTFKCCGQELAVKS